MSSLHPSCCCSALSNTFSQGYLSADRQTSAASRSDTGSRAREVGVGSCAPPYSGRSLRPSPCPCPPLPSPSAASPRSVGHRERSFLRIRERGDDEAKAGQKCFAEFCWPQPICACGTKATQHDVARRTRTNNQLVKIPGDS
jgi:hypothetical protein